MTIELGYEAPAAIEPLGTVQSARLMNAGFMPSVL